MRVRGCAGAYQASPALDGRTRPVGVRLRAFKCAGSQVWTQPLYSFVEEHLFKRFPNAHWLQKDLARCARMHPRWVRTCHGKRRQGE